MFTTIRTVLVVAVLFGALGCQGGQRQGGVVPAESAAVAAFDARSYQRIAEEKGRVYWIDSEASDVRFFLWRGGPQAAKGHNHVMAVKNIDGAMFLPTNMLEDAVKFDIVFRVADIGVDPPALRKELGGAFAVEISPDGIEGTRRNMLGSKALDAQRFPTVGLRARKVHGELPKLVLDTTVTLHGVRKRLLIPATVSVKGSRLSAVGSFAIRQTDFGIDPFSALGGALYVQDPVMIEFDLRFDDSARPR